MGRPAPPPLFFGQVVDKVLDDVKDKEYNPLTAGGSTENGRNDMHNWTAPDSFRIWHEAPERLASRELDFGCRWMELTPSGTVLDAPRWRVSWIEQTGELYGRQLSEYPRWHVLGVYRTRGEVEELLRGWAREPMVLCGSVRLANEHAVDFVANGFVLRADARHVQMRV